MRLLPLAVCALLGSAGLSALLAQTVDGLDLEAVKRRSQAMQAEVEAFADQVKDRGAEFREQAETVRMDAQANLHRVASSDLPKGPAGPVDFDEIVAGADANARATRGEAPQLIVFASLSMPEASLRQLIADTARAGGVVVFRGFPNNSMKLFTQAIAKVVERQDENDNIGIDPRLFRAFEVRAVPTYVVVSSDFDLCAGFSCRTAVPPFDRIIGNVTVDYALSTFAEGGGPGAAVARVGLANLRKTRP